MAWGGLKLLIAVLPADTFPDEAVISLNLRVLAATVTVAIGAALFFGLMPLVGGLRQDVNEALKSGSRAHSSFRNARFRHLLIVSEVAVSLVLFSAAAVLMRSFIREREVQPGINDTAHVLTAFVSLNKANRTAEQQTRFNRDLTTTVRRMPSVIDVSATTDFPLFGGAITEFAFPDGKHTEQYDGRFALIDPNLFRTLGIRLLRRRNLTELDLAAKHLVAVVNQTFVTRFFPGQDVIGRRVQVTTLAYLPTPIPKPWVEIVGVVADSKNQGLRQPVLPQVFLPNTLSALGGFCLVVHTAGDPAALAKTVEGAALTLDATTVVRRIRTIQQLIESQEYAKPRFGLQIFSVFAALAMLLVSLGLYSIMSYAVSQRKHELSLRMALGATRADVQNLIMKTGMRFLVAGIAAGLLVAFFALRLISSQLWSTGPYDPMALLSSVSTLILVGLAACYLPSRLATRIDPAQTLRAE